MCRGMLRRELFKVYFYFDVFDATFQVSWWV